jgi:hypothetical protein
MTQEEREQEFRRATEEANKNFQEDSRNYLESVRDQYWQVAKQEATHPASLSGSSTTTKTEKEELKDLVLKMSKTKEFMTKMASSILDEIPKITKQYKDAKTVVTQGLFMGPAKLIHQDIIRRMEEQEGQQIIRDWTTSGDLVKLMSALQKIMILGPSTRVHPSLLEPMHVTEFISSSLWDGKPKSLASFIRTLDSN